MMMMMMMTMMVMMAMMMMTMMMMTMMMMYQGDQPADLSFHDLAKGFMLHLRDVNEYCKSHDGKDVETSYNLRPFCKRTSSTNNET